MANTRLHLTGIILACVAAWMIAITYYVAGYVFVLGPLELSYGAVFIVIACLCLDSLRILCGNIVALATSILSVSTALFVNNDILDTDRLLLAILLSSPIGVLIGNWVSSLLKHYPLWEMVYITNVIEGVVTAFLFFILLYVGNSSLLMVTSITFKLATSVFTMPTLLGMLMLSGFNLRKPRE